MALVWRIRSTAPRLLPKEVKFHSDSCYGLFPPLEMMSVVDIVVADVVADVVIVDVVVVVADVVVGIVNE